MSRVGGLVVRTKKKGSSKRAAAGLPKTGWRDLFLVPACQLLVVLILIQNGARGRIQEQGAR